jgi:hypothetical protein
MDHTKSEIFTSAGKTILNILELLTFLAIIK